MSLFSSQTTWPPQCLSANQSPINLSQTSTKPCEVTCDLVMDDGYISQATVSVSDEGLILSNSSGLGTCKFRGQSYVCNMLHINHPSNHTIEGVQADGEVIAYCYKPTGELLCISALFRSNPSQTSSYTFFKQFIPYALTTGDTPIKLQDWSLAMMVPPSSSYFTYAGSTIVPPCSPCEWVVFKTMINMDQDDFAYLVRNVEAGSRSLSAQGSREVYFNDTQNLSGVMPNDGKMYLRLRPTGNTQMPSLSQTGQKPKKDIKLKSEPEDPNKPISWTGKRQKELNDHIKSNGGYLGTFEFWIMIVAVIAGCYYGYNISTKNPFSTEFIKPVSSWTRDTLGDLWNFLLTIPGIIYDWTIGWFTFLTRPRRDGRVLSMGATPAGPPAPIST